MRCLKAIKCFPLKAIFHSLLSFKISISNLAPRDIGNVGALRSSSPHEPFIDEFLKIIN